MRPIGFGPGTSRRPSPPMISPPIASQSSSRSMAPWYVPAEPAGSHRKRGESAGQAGQVAAWAKVPRSRSLGEFHLPGRLPHGGAQVDGRATVVQRSRAIAEQPACHRCAAGVDGAAADEDRDHLSQVWSGGDDDTTAQRRARRARYRRPTCLVHHVGPALGEFPPLRWRDDLARANGEGMAGSRRTPGREVAIEGGGQRAGEDAITRPPVLRRCVVSGGLGQQSGAHASIVTGDTRLGKWQN